MKKIAYLTGTRADFGRMKPLLKEIIASDDYELKLIVTGMHLLQWAGFTIYEIEKEFKISFSFDMFPDSCIDSSDRMVRGFGICIKELSEIFKTTSIDLLISFGDRGEMLAGAIVATHFGCKVLHIGGGDKTGCIDDNIRNAISCFSDYHVVSNDYHLKKLIDMGINQSNIRNYGSMDIDALLRVKERAINSTDYIENVDNFCILIFHPDTKHLDEIGAGIEAILKVLSDWKGVKIVIYPNVDTGREVIMRSYDQITDSDFRFYSNIPYDIFIHLLQRCQFLIGNSSTGIIECSYLGIPVINVGKRQINRIHGNNVIDVMGNVIDIQDAIKRISQNFDISLLENRYIYGDGHTVDKIKNFMDEILNG